MKYLKNKNIVAGLIFLIISLIYFFQTFSLQVIQSLSINPGFLPRIYGIVLFILSIALIIGGYKETDKTVKENDLEEAVIDSGTGKLMRRDTILTILVLGLAIAMMRPFGFIISGIFYLISSFIVLSKTEEREIVKFVIISVATVVAIYLVFVEGLDLLLPSGSLGGVL